MSKFKKLISLLLCGAMFTSLVFASACNAESGKDPEGDTYIDNTETPDDGTGDGEAETPDDGTGDGEAETPDDGTGDGETETPDDGTGDGEAETPDDETGDGEAETPDDGTESGETVYTVTQSGWNAALSYEKFLNCTVSLYLDEDGDVSRYTGYLGLSESNGIITGKVYCHGEYLGIIDGVETVRLSFDSYEYQTDTYYLYTKYYGDSSKETEYSKKNTTAGYYNRLSSVPDSQEPFFMFLNEREDYFNYSDYVYNETTHEYVYEISGVGNAIVAFENGYVTNIQINSDIGSKYWDWKYSDYGTTNVENYFTDEITSDMSDYCGLSIE